MILLSVVAGRYMDFVTHGGHVPAHYRNIFLWAFCWQVVACVFMQLLYRNWLRYGGPDRYVPPAVG